MDPYQGPVLVTGAAGWLASFCIVELIKQGFRVRGTVRNLKNKSHYAFLNEAVPDLPEGALEFVEADLTGDAAQWDAACAGCIGVLHVAGVIKLDSRHPRKDLLLPALKGIDNIFNAALRSKTVKRIVLTSSIAAVSEDYKDWKKKTYSAADFNDRSNLKHNPYFYSKVAEERAAAKFVAEHPELSLVVICPNSIVGPSLNSSVGLATRESIVRLLRGKVPVRIPYFVGWVDVRDLALMHVKALTVEAAGGQRFLASMPFEPMDHLIDLVGEAWPEKKKVLPRRHVSGSLVLGFMRLTMPIGEYRALKWSMNKQPKLENSNVQSVLGVEYRPLEETVKDTIEFIKQRKIVV